MNRPMHRGFEYRDVSLIPRLSAIAPADVSLHGRLSRKIYCRLPLIASPMDTVVCPAMSEKLAIAGSVPILLHRDGAEQDVVAELRRLKALDPSIRAGVLISPRTALSAVAAKELATVADVLLLDTLHAAPDKHLDAVKALKDRFPDTDVVSGNVVHVVDAATLIAAGADAIRVGMSSASINDGYAMTGCARAQAVAVKDCAVVCADQNVPLLADGGIQSVGQIAIAFALGASTVMMGKMFAALSESAAPFTDESCRYKVYKGMSRGGLVDADLLQEAKEERIEVKGDFDTVINLWCNSLRVALSRNGARSIPDLHASVEFEIR